jgi:hypothetical protein
MYPQYNNNIIIKNTKKSQYRLFISLGNQVNGFKINEVKENWENQLVSVIVFDFQHLLDISKSKVWWYKGLSWI